MHRARRFKVGTATTVVPDSAGCGESGSVGDSVAGIKTQAKTS
ncbi:hypothetical protein ABTU75_19885 [Acinetobacter baumannii]